MVIEDKVKKFTLTSKGVRVVFISKFRIQITKIGIQICRQYKELVENLKNFLRERKKHYEDKDNTKDVSSAVSVFNSDDVDSNVSIC